MLLDHPQQICGHERRLHNTIINLPSISSFSFEEKTRFCGNGFKARTHFGPHQESQGRVLWWITCRADTWLYFFLHKRQDITPFEADLCHVCTWRQRKMCRASRQTWRRSTTRQGKGYGESPGSLNSRPGNGQRKMLQFKNHRLTVPTVLAAARIESKIGPTHIAHPGREQGLYKDSGNSSSLTQI